MITTLAYLLVMSNMAFYPGKTIGEVIFRGIVSAGIFTIFVFK